MQFYFPLEYFHVTQPFGAFNSMYSSGRHMGVDLRTGERGVPVFAAQSGKVVVAKGEAPYDGYGCHIAIDHSNGIFSIYGHLDVLKCSEGDEVALGQCIGLSGGSPQDYGARAGQMKIRGAFTKAGASTAYHLHYELDRGAVGASHCINPTPLTIHDPDINKKYLISLQPKPMEPWQIQAMKWAKDNGISTGERPLDKLTRVELWETLRKFAIAFGLKKV